MNSSCRSVTSICNDVIAVTVSSAVSKFDQVLVSDEVLVTFTSVVDTWSSLVIAFLGIVCNVLTIIVFAGLGFKDTVNITMTVIAFWDLVRVLCGAIHRCYGPLSLLSPTLGKSWQNITIPNVNSLQNIASNVAYVIGGYVALERCLCISFPFRVKSLMTPKVTWLACSALSIIVITSLFPSLFLLEIQWMKSTGQDELVAIYRYSTFYFTYGLAYMNFYKYFNLLYPFISLSVMMVSTAIISYILRKSSSFRKKMLKTPTTPKQGTQSTSTLTKRDVQVVKMLLLVIMSYILVLVPRVTTFMVQLFEPEFIVLRFYNNIFRLIVGVILFLDFVNSSSGLAIYYFMSSKFRSRLQWIIRNAVIGCSCSTFK
ncbi:N-formyl peptide receptor 2 [Biomphalaria glabrata]|nr:N-formyl peptide receptor 2-like [Biomphalaria glabrata]